MGEGIFKFGLRTSRRRYTKDLQSFANKVLARGYANGSLYIFGNTNKAFLRDLSRKGINIKSDQCVVTDKTILKYPHHPKKKKGATLNIHRFRMLEAAVKRPKNVYIDTNRNRLVYVCAVKYSKTKVLKVVIEPNQNIKGRYYNKVVSYGVVDKVDMKGKQYQKIK